MPPQFTDDWFRDDWVEYDDPLYPRYYEWEGQLVLLPRQPRECECHLPHFGSRSLRTPEYFRLKVECNTILDDKAGLLFRRCCSLRCLPAPELLQREPLRRLISTQGITNKPVPPQLYTYIPPDTHNGGRLAPDLYGWFTYIMHEASISV